jgi:hypothetical protein
MASVFIVGLPTFLLKRFNALAERGELEVDSILAALGSEGYFRLSPDPEQAVHALTGYADTLGEFSDAKILVLPYAPIPRSLSDELQFIKDYEGEVTYFSAGQNGWPKATVSEFNERFYNSVLDAIVAHLFPKGKPKELLPSEYFAAASDRQRNLLIPGGSVTSCDDVATHRYKFMRKATDALERVAAHGHEGTVEEFFNSFGLLHAQSGGILAELEVFRSGKRLHKGGSQTHLKQGDGTKKIAAARIYYYRFDIDKPYVAILYAGPHPDNNVARQHSLGD